MRGGVENHGAEVVSDPNRQELGRFLRATRAFPRGALVLREATPLLRVPGGAGRRPLPAAATSAAGRLRAAGLFVPDASGPLAVVRRDAPDGESEDALFVRSVLHFNSFAAGPGGRDQVVFATLARANHACAPNCIADGDEGTLRAVRDIQEGEAITVSYLDEASLLFSRRRRRAELLHRWSFHCECARCTSHIDDTRRFRGCQVPGCDGDLIVEEDAAEGTPTRTGHVALRCAVCQNIAEEAQAKDLLRAEAAAAGHMAIAMSGEMEEVDEGQELLRCYRFARTHPTHNIALELAHEFSFPDPVPAKQALLAGLQAVLGDFPCQLAVDTHRILADFLAARGELDAARDSLKEAAATAALLDGADVAAAAEKAAREADARFRKMSRPPAHGVAGGDRRRKEDEPLLDPLGPLGGGDQSAGGGLITKGARIGGGGGGGDKQMNNAVAADADAGAGAEKHVDEADGKLSRRKVEDHEPLKIPSPVKHNSAVELPSAYAVAATAAAALAAAAIASRIRSAGGSGF